MLFFALFAIVVFLAVMLITVGSLETPEENVCRYKGACSSVTCPYWKNCRIKE